MSARRGLAQPRYWSSRKSQWTNRAPHTPSAASSSLRRRTMCSAGLVTPDALSQGATLAAADGNPAKSVTTMAGWAAAVMACQQDSTASSRCGEMIRRPVTFVSVSAARGGRAHRLGDAQEDEQGRQELGPLSGESAEVWNDGERD